MYFSPKIEEIVSLQKYQDEWSLDTTRQEIMKKIIKQSRGAA